MWIGKQAVVRHHAEVPFRLLEEVKELSCPSAEGDTENLIVQGDNLEALKALLPRYAGKVKCIYIDPPYNTGNEGWVYNDAVNSPEIRQWLGAAVGKEAEDLSRHDKWLCMMYPRLVLLRQFLHEDGAIFISIDDNEVASLRLLMDEIFSGANFIAHFIWEKRKNRENRKTVSVRHDHIIAYARDANQALSRFHLLPMNPEALARYKSTDNDKRGPWKSDPATAQAGHATKSQFYVLKAPSGKVHHLPSGRCWVYTEDAMMEAIAAGRIWFGASGNNVPRIKTFLQEKERGLTPETILFAREASTNEDAKNALKEIFGGKALFETPKPVELVVQFLRMCTRNSDLILDSFAGSGTTGHAILRQNTEDGGNRRFILVEMDPKIACDITAERVRRVAKGYTNTKGEAVAALGGGFRFVKLGKTLFDEKGAIRADVKFLELAEFVYFHETGRPLPKPARGQKRTPLLGTHDGRAVYLFFNGILDDRTVDGGNVLTSPVLAALATHDGPKVIYAAACRLGRARLEAELITFKQTPYDLQIP